jgi:YidC/Oxa1 family membrane protein insertase
LPLASYLGDENVDRDLVMVKRYRLLPVEKGAKAPVAANSEAYSIDYEMVIENHGAKAVDVSLRQEGLSGITLEGWWYSVKISPYFFRGAGQRDVRFGDATGNHSIVLARSIYDRKLKTPRDPGLFVDAGGSPALRTLRYVGLDTQYFAAAFLPHPESPDGLANLHQAGSDAFTKVSSLPASQAQATNTSFWFETSKQSIAPASQLATRYRIFAGPKDTAVLAHYGLDRFIEYGWIPLITKPLSWILFLFYSVVPNYGIAIIMLTLLVRGGMFPLGRQAAVNAQKMQELQPEMKRINDLYKEDMQKRADAMRELYSKHNFRPFASCLPLFLQIPIFMGLYRCLSVDISLRQEPLIPGLSWCSNLAGPDMLFDWSSWMPEIIAGRGTGYLGPYFNILPLVTVGLFLLQQKILMPKATDEQTQMTQNMMQVMTVVMGVLFFKVPSGLCIYFITSSLWSLAERKLVKRLVPNKPALAAAPLAISKPVVSAAGTNRNQKDADKKRPQSRMAARLAGLREMLDKPAVRSGTQRRDPDKTKKRKR